MRAAAAEARAFNVNESVGKLLDEPCTWRNEEEAELRAELFS